MVTFIVAYRALWILNCWVEAYSYADTSEKYPTLNL